MSNCLSGRFYLTGLDVWTGLERGLDAWGVTEGSVAKDRSRSLPQKVKRLSHEQRQARRRDMSVAVAAGSSLPATARQFGVTITTVRSACRENGVEVKPEK